MWICGLAVAALGKPHPWPSMSQECGAAIGLGRRKGGKKEAGRKIRPSKPRECGAMTGASRPLEWPMIPPEWGTRRRGTGLPEWQKNHGGPATE